MLSWVLLGIKYSIDFNIIDIFINFFFSQGIIIVLSLLAVGVVYRKIFTYGRGRFGDRFKTIYRRKVEFGKSESKK